MSGIKPGKHGLDLLYNAMALGSTSSCQLISENNRLVYSNSYSDPEGSTDTWSSECDSSPIAVFVSPNDTYLSTPSMYVPTTPKVPDQNRVSRRSSAGTPQIRHRKRLPGEFFIKVTRRVKDGATREDLVDIYEEFSSCRPMVETVLPIWVPDDGYLFLSRRSLPVTDISRMVNDRYLEIMSRDDIKSMTGQLDEIETKTVGVVLKRCLKIALENTTEKNGLLPWLNGWGGIQ